jgi:hypothetical protein
MGYSNGFRHEQLPIFIRQANKNEP